MLDYRGISSFLLLTFGITYAVEIWLILAGLRFSSGIRPTGAKPSSMRYIPLLIGILMWVPGLAALFTVKIVTYEDLAILNLRFGPWKPYLVTALLVPAIFAVIYGLTWLLGLGKPDWRIKSLAPAAKIPPAFILPGIFFASIILGPTINGLFGLGEELGWRGYLLPKLMPLGKLEAYLILGIIWGLWHAPLIAVGFNYPGYPILGMVCMSAMTTAFGIFINDFTLQNQSTILAGWIHGAANGQIYGVWRVLFPKVNPLLGGFTGVVGIAVWALVGVLF